MLRKTDPQIYSLIEKEKKRQKEELEMIPSENYVSGAVLAATGSVLTNKYSEGYPYKRYYQGNRFIDEIETLAINRAKKLFKVPHVNVQPYSGSPMNSAVFMAILNPNDRVVGLKLDAGGHLTHGHPKVTFSGRFFQSSQIGVNENGYIDYDELDELVAKVKPKLIIIGTTAYPRIFDWKRLSEIARKTNSWLVADISHITGLIVGKVHPDPVPFVHIVTTTTHKTLRGPRGGMILITEKGLSKDPDLAKKIDSAVFPGLQGGPHDNTTAAIAVALLEASQPKFKTYAKQIVINSKKLAETLMKNGINLVTGGTDNHLLVMDLRNQKIIGNITAYALERAGIITNKNTVPKDPNPPAYPSGIRLGTPALTSRNMKEKEMDKIGQWIVKVIDHIGETKLPEDKTKRKEYIKSWKKKIDKDRFYQDIRKDVLLLTKKFPVPGI